MRKTFLKYMACGITLSVLITSCSKDDEMTEAGQDNGQVIEGQYIVVFKDNNKNFTFGKNLTHEATNALVKQSASEILTANGIQAENIQLAFSHVYKGISMSATSEEISLLRHDDRVAYIEPDRLIIQKRPPDKGIGSLFFPVSPR